MLTKISNAIFLCLFLSLTQANLDFLLNFDLEKNAPIIPKCQKDTRYVPYRVYEYDLTVIRVVKALNKALNDPEILSDYHHVHYIRSVFLSVKDGIIWRFNANLVHTNCSNTEFGISFNEVDYDLKCGSVQDLNCKIKAVTDPYSNDVYIDQYQCINYEKNSLTRS